MKAATKNTPEIQEARAVIVMLLNDPHGNFGSLQVVRECAKGGCHPRDCENARRVLRVLGESWEEELEER
jgi:hypothetical protein